MSTTRRPPGTGMLYVRTDAAGRETWYGKFVADGSQIKRRIGLKRLVSGDPPEPVLSRSVAEKELRALMTSTRARPIEARAATVRSVGDAVIARGKNLGRKAATIEGYGSMLTVHLEPYFEETPLDRIKPADIERLMAVTREAGRKPKTIRNLIMFLSSIFTEGLRQHVVTANPCREVERPRERRSVEIRFLDQAELEACLRKIPSGAEAEDDEFAKVEPALYLTAAMAGLRMGELLGLRWRDVDWQARRIRVRQSFVRGEFGDPKSDRGSRSVPLADRVAGELDRLFKASAYQADDDLVFCHPALGKPLDRSKVLKRFQAALKAAGVRIVRFHDLRHTFGTRMAAAGVPLRTLMEWMGHADFKTTLIYADYQPSAREADLVDAAFAPLAVPEVVEATTP